MTNHERLVREYAERIVDGMSQRELEMWALHALRSELETVPEEQLVAEIQSVYPELLDENSN